MTPTKLTLKGFIGIQSGQGKREFTLDLEPILDDAQLIAIVGDNGSGKTTVMDNLHPYRIMPSRASSYSPGSFSFYDNTMPGEAVKELEWKHEGQHYKSTILIKSTAKTKTTTAYLHVRAGDEWIPAQSEDGVKSDGKIATYDAILESILGSPEMFFTSVFASQGKRSLSSYSNSEIKTLMAELLDLEHIRDLQARAKEVAKGLAIHQQAMNGKLAEIAAKEQKVQQKRAAEKQRAVEIDELKKRATDAREKVEDGKIKYRCAQDDYEGNLQVEVRRKELKSLIAGLDQKIGSLATELSTIVQRKTADLKRVCEESTDVNMRRDRANEDLRIKIEKQREMLGMEEKIAAAKNALIDLDQQSMELEKELGRLSEQDEQRQKNQIEQSGLVEKLNRLKQDGIRIKRESDELGTRSQLIQEVPCRGTQYQSGCKLLADANTAAARMPEVKTKLEETRKQYGHINGLLDSLRKDYELLSSIQDAVRDARARQSEIQRNREDNQRIVALEPSIENIERVIQSFEEQIAANEENAARQIKSLEQRAREIEQHVAEATAKIQAELDEHNKTRVTLKAELEAMPPPSDTAAIDMANKALTAAEMRLDEIGEEMQRAQAVYYRIGAEIDSLTAELEESKQIPERAARFDAEIAQWNLLVKALGHDGIISLAIDAAGPEISMLTNDLLLACFGPRFTIRIATQEQKANGEYRETFDIRVLDSETDDEKSIGDLSGGERVWIETAVSRAITLFQSQSSGRRYGTLFSDESDGSLDPERKRYFVAMKREALKIGGFSHEFFITHTPGLVDLADRVIDFNRLAVVSGNAVISD